MLNIPGAEESVKAKFTNSLLIKKKKNQSIKEE